MGWSLFLFRQVLITRIAVALIVLVGSSWCSSIVARAEQTSTPNKRLLARAGQVAFEAQVPSLLFYSLIQVESNWQHLSESSAGAIGLTQLLPTTAEDLGVNPLLIDENLRGGAQYLREMMDRFEDWPRALAAYNAGPAAVTSAGGVPDFAETRAYVPRVLKGMRNARLLRHLKKISGEECPSRAKLETDFGNLKVANIYWNYSAAASFALVYLADNCVAIKSDDLNTAVIYDGIEIPERSGWLLLSHVDSTELYFDEVSSEVFAFSSTGAFSGGQLITAADEADPDAPGAGVVVDYQASAALRQGQLKFSFGSVEFDVRRAVGPRVLGGVRIGSQGEVSDVSAKAIHETDSRRFKYGTITAPDVPARPPDRFLGVAFLRGLDADDADSYAPGPVGFSNVLPGIVRVYAGDRLVFEDNAAAGPKDVEISEFPLESGELRYEFENILGEKFEKSFDYTRISGLLPVGKSRTGLYVGLEEQNASPFAVALDGWLLGVGHEIGIREGLTLGMGGHLRSDAATLAVEGRGRLGDTLSWSTGLSYTRAGSSQRMRASGSAVWNSELGVVDGLSGKFRWSSVTGPGEPDATRIAGQVSTRLELYGWDAFLTTRVETKQAAAPEVEVIARANRRLGAIGALSLEVVTGRDTRELEIGFGRSWRLGGQYSVGLDLDWTSERSERRDLARFARELRLRRDARGLDDWTASMQLRQREIASDALNTSGESVAGSIRVPTGIGVLDGFAYVNDGRAGARWTGRIGFRGRAALVQGKFSLGRASGLQTLFVDTKGVPGLPVYVNGGRVGVTNGRGVFLGDVLPSGSRSTVSIEVADVPLQFAIEDAETKMSVKPGVAGVYRVEFPFKEIVPIIIKLVDESDAPLPGGLLVLGDKDSKAYVITDGRTYLENGYDFERGEVVDGEGELVCEFELDLDAIVSTVAGEVVDIGEVLCE